MACKRSGVRIPIAPHIGPGQMWLWDRLAGYPRSLDRHWTVDLSVAIEQATTRIGTPRPPGRAGPRRPLNMPRAASVGSVLPASSGSEQRVDKVRYETGRACLRGPVKASVAVDHDLHRHL